MNLFRISKLERQNNEGHAVTKHVYTQFECIILMTEKFSDVYTLNRGNFILCKILLIIYIKQV